MATKFRRICLVVLDSAGIGEMPDAERGTARRAETENEALLWRFGGTGVRVCAASGG